ncbi:MAG: MoaD/ThiS family protein [Thermodesulfobacteriota bacterium]
MKIQLNLFATLSRYKPEGGAAEAMTIACEEGLTIRELLVGLGLPMDQVKLIFVNGVHAQPDAVLKNGDRVGVFPPVGGG